MPSKPSCSTGLVQVLGRAGSYPAVEPLLGVGDRGFFAVPCQHPGLPRQAEQPLADRGQLPWQVRELPLMRRRTAGKQRVPREDNLEIRAVQADRAGRVTWGVDDLELDVRDVEPAAIGHLDLGGG